MRLIGLVVTLVVVAGNMVWALDDCCPYTVQHGDTCTSIEDRFGLHRGSLIAKNRFVINDACSNLVPGQVICAGQDHHHHHHHGHHDHHHIEHYKHHDHYPHVHPPVIPHRIEPQHHEHYGHHDHYPHIHPPVAPHHHHHEHYGHHDHYPHIHPPVIPQRIEPQHHEHYGHHDHYPHIHPPVAPHHHDHHHHHHHCSSHHIVQAGETCNSIAAVHHLSVHQLLSLNHEVNPGCTNLKAGQLLCICA